MALVGAPVPGPDGQAYIAMLAVRPDGVAVLYRKQWTGGDEATRFSPGDEPAVTEVDGWRIGVGICRDTGIGAHVEQMAALDIDVYVAGLVHRADELSEQETAGSSAIWSPAGDVLAQAGMMPGDVARATLE
jgi:predicted amidohydrolase